MAIAVTCQGCNRTMQVKDDFAGQRALCPFCKGEVQVPERQPPREANEYPLAPDDRDHRADREEPPRRRPRLHEDHDVRQTRSGRGTSSGVLTGVLMMAGAVIWFFGALALGRMFLYPPILFIVGLVTFIKGLSGRED